MIIEETKKAVKSMRPTRTKWLIAAGLFVASFILYVATTAPDVLPGDAGEFQFAAWRLGLPHPTGYPLYMLVGSAWQHGLSVLAINPAFALNLLSGLFAASAVTAMYIFMLPVSLHSRSTRYLIAVFSALLLASNGVLWSQAVIAEVYALQALIVLALFILLQRLSFVCKDDRTSIACSRTLIAGAFVLGMGFAHHATTILLLPAIAVYLWQLHLPWRRFGWRTWLFISIAFLLPLMLYAYIPLRSGLGASPWLHQPMGDGTLSLYQNDWPHFINYITGRSISVGFNDSVSAINRLPDTLSLWHASFGVLGLLLMALGVYVLALRNRPLLWLTAVLFATQQLFNLHYAIDDIAAYYIPLFIVGVIWAGYGAAGLADGVYTRWMGSNTRVQPNAAMGTRIVLLLCLLPIWHIWGQFNTIDRSHDSSARTMWEEILAVAPDEPVILVSNDRDEIPPLMYMQYVEGRAPSATALHPLMAPDDRFSDIGATIDTALRDGAGTPVFLIKEMPSLEIKYDVEHSMSPLVGVETRQIVEPMVTAEQQLGGLTLQGYDWITDPLDETDAVLVRLYWQVNEPTDKDYTTSVQVFNADEQKLAQNDAAPGGVYYPTSLWKQGETLVEEHALSMLTNAQNDASILQIGMYTGADFTMLGAPLRLQLSDPTE